MQGVIIRTALVLFGILVGLGASEVALRFVRKAPKGSEFQSLDDLRRSMLKGDTDAGGKDHSVNLAAIINPHPDDQIIYDLRPNNEVTFQGVPVKTNGCGMRGREVSIRKPEGTVRVAFLGDSFTFGWGVKIEDAFTSVVERNLNRVEDGKQKVEVLNFGVPGYSTFQEVALFKERGLDFSPDVVVVYFVENDFGLPFYVRDLNNPSKLLPSLGIFKLASQALGKSDAERFQSSNFDANRSLLDLASVCEARGIPVLLVINPKTSEVDSRRKLWALKQHRIKYFSIFNDLKRAIADEGVPENTLQLPNDRHPSAVKHRILGDIMTPHIWAALPAQRAER